LPQVVVLLGFSNVIADGIAMGVGDYWSTKAEVRGRSSTQCLALAASIRCLPAARACGGS
jgi:hypothetical protein